MTGSVEELAREIEGLLGRCQSLVRAESAADLQEARWSYSRGKLRWRVFFAEEVLEPDVDVELTRTVCVVRARPLRDPTRVLLCLLPVPESFDASRAEIRFSAGTLEIRVGRP